jgi:hypothetical protein
MMARCQSTSGINKLFSGKGQVVNILGFASSVVFAVTVHSTFMVQKQS